MVAEDGDGGLPVAADVSRRMVAEVGDAGDDTESADSRRRLRESGADGESCDARSSPGPSASCSDDPICVHPCASVVTLPACRLPLPASFACLTLRLCCGKIAPL